MSHPTAFISYSYDDDAHCQWVKKLATRLRTDGVDVTLDQWHAVLGDQLPQFMEKAIRENNFVLIVCTPNYKRKSDNREGGAGYEGDIITAEIFTTRNHRKFITILARETLETSMPTALKGKYYVDLSISDASETSYQDLLSTLLGNRPQAPPIGSMPKTKITTITATSPVDTTFARAPDILLKITGIILDEVSEPRMDNTPGSALYQVPFRLSRIPSRTWSEIFLNEWNHPKQYTSMHRPGIARVFGDKIILDGTTIDEVRRYHRDTLILCVNETNLKEAQYAAKLAMQEENERKKHDNFRRGINNASRDIEF